MKIGIIGDIHGRKNWKKFVQDKTIDIWIFIGDYFDSKELDLTAQIQIDNFTEILEFKKSNPDNVVLLTGNHDFHYISGIGEDYSGYQHFSAIAIRKVVEQAIKENLIQMCFLKNNFLFTHAGLTKTWCRQSLGVENPIVNDELVSLINDTFIYTPKKFCFTIGYNFSVYGDDVTQGPIWVRPMSLIKDMVDNVTCVVGHTSVETIKIRPFENPIILIDCLGYEDNFLIIENGEARTAF